MNDNAFDHLLLPVSKTMTQVYMETLAAMPEFQSGEVDTSPLLNLTLGVYLGSLIHILDKIKNTTEGEEKLMKNISLARTNIIKAIKDLPFISKIEFV